MALQQRPSTSAPSDGSRTMTIESLAFDTPSDGNEIVGVLRLRGGPRRNRQRVVWGEDVVDNEGCGKKKSKSEWCASVTGRHSLFRLVCCIYHRPRPFDESSDEDSSSGSDSDSACENGDHCHRRTRRPHKGGEDEPNAYEKMPSPQKGKE
jgi:protein phosphatase 1 regulatory subunit 11